jgi:hypothetical protein
LITERRVVAETVVDVADVPVGIAVRTEPSIQIRNG